MENDIKKELVYFINRDLYEEIESYQKIWSNNFVTTVPFDYTGYTAKMQVRRRTQSKDPNVFFTLSTDDDTIVLSEGLITLSLAKENITIQEGEYVYDIVVINSDDISQQHVYGTFFVKDSTTNI